PLLEHQLARLGQLDVDPVHELDHLFDPLGRPALEPGRVPKRHDHVLHLVPPYLGISAPGTGALTSETEPRQHFWTRLTLRVLPRRNEMRLDLLEGVRTLQRSGLHSSHASGITDTLTERGRPGAHPAAGG